MCTAGCSVDSVPAACAAKWGPTGKQYLQDPDKAFRIITVRATQVTAGFLKVSVYVDGYHSSAQPPGYLTGNAASNTYAATDPGVALPAIANLRLGVKTLADLTGPLFLSGDVAELMIYNAALTVPEMDRVANYLSRKFALGAFRFDDGFASPTRSVPLSCSNCAGPGPVGEAGTTYDSHLILAASTGTVNTGTVTFATSATAFTISAATSTPATLVGSLITVCVGLCSVASPTARGTAVITAASGASSTIAITPSGVGVVGVAVGDGYFISANDKCAEDWGAVAAVASTTQVTLAVTQVAGANAMTGALLAVCAGLCVRASDATARISNLRGSAVVASSTAGLVATLATPIAGVAVGDAVVLYNAHKAKLQTASNATGLAGIGTDSFYSFAGFYMYFKSYGRCGGRGTRIVSYTAATFCATLGTGFEVGDYLADANAIAATDLAADGACRGSNCQGPDTGGIGGAAAGHVSSVKVLSTSLLTGCAVGHTLSVDGSAAFAAAVASVSTGAITSVAFTNHGSGLRAGSFVTTHGSTIGTVTGTTSFVLATGSGSPAAANALAGLTILVCIGLCPSAITSANLAASVRGSSTIATSTAGAAPTVTVATWITGVTQGDEYVFWGGPAVYSNNAVCKCNGNAFNTAALAFNSIPCLRALVANWSDAQDGCAPGGAQDYLLVRDAGYKAVAASDYLAGRATVVAAGTGSSGPAAGGTVFAARGAYLYPNDAHLSSAPSVTNVQLLSGPEAALNALYVRVTFGAACSTNPNSDRYCLRSAPVHAPPPFRQDPREWRREGRRRALGPRPACSAEAPPRGA